MSESHLTGVGVTMTIDTLQNGGVLYGPLTGEFLQTVEERPQVRQKYTFFKFN